MLCRATSSQRAVDTYHAPCVSALRRGRSERRRYSYIRRPRNHTRGRSRGDERTKLCFVEPLVFEPMQ